MSLYNSNGLVNLTVVPGTSYTGLQAADGSYNVVLSLNNTPKGVQHPCGAYWGTVVTLPFSGAYAVDGSMNIIQNGDLSYSIL